VATVNVWWQLNKDYSTQIYIQIQMGRSEGRLISGPSFVGSVNHTPIFSNFKFQNHKFPKDIFPNHIMYDEPTYCRTD
jgi:hypothetical protein